jgi:hypothetical protein
MINVIDFSPIKSSIEDSSQVSMCIISSRLAYTETHQYLSSDLKIFPIHMYLALRTIALIIMASNFYIDYIQEWEDSLEATDII